MKQVLRTILLAGTLLGLGIAQAQTVTELAHHPNDVLRFEIKFDGADAPKISQVTFLLQLKGAVPANQPGFSANQQSAWVSQSSPNSFQVELKIDDKIATGTYVAKVIANAIPESDFL